MTSYDKVPHLIQVEPLIVVADQAHHHHVISKRYRPVGAVGGHTIIGV